MRISNDTDNIIDNFTDDITDNDTVNIIDNDTVNIIDNLTDYITDNITNNNTDNITNNDKNNNKNNNTDNNKNNNCCNFCINEHRCYFLCFLYFVDLTIAIISCVFIQSKKNEGACNFMLPENLQRCQESVNKTLQQVSNCEKIRKIIFSFANSSNESSKYICVNLLEIIENVVSNNNDRNHLKIIVIVFDNLAIFSWIYFAGRSLLREKFECCRRERVIPNECQVFLLSEELNFFLASCSLLSLLTIINDNQTFNSIIGCLISLHPIIVSILLFYYDMKLKRDKLPVNGSSKPYFKELKKQLKKILIAYKQEFDRVDQRDNEIQAIVNEIMLDNTI